jgi:3D-(3,5/4)-trihydroxycyclohexane-1,2-dione acylhydrolase (decyclizing)
MAAKNRGAQSDMSENAHNHPAGTDRYSEASAGRCERAAAIARYGGLDKALTAGAIPRRVNLTLSEAVVLGLLRQRVSRYIGVLGHGSTEVGEVLRIYEAAGLVRTYNVRHEVEAAHAATALRWVTGEKAAVITSIGPGALQAMAGSLAATADGIGVWHLYGDETTEDEGPNMQQIPRAEQGLFLRLCQTMGQAYCLNTPQAVGTALRRGLNTVDHPHRAGPFYLLLPMNKQASVISDFNLDELPAGSPPALGAAADEGMYEKAINALLTAKRVVVKVGGGARGAGPEIAEFLDRIDGVAVTSPIVSGVLPYRHPRNMTVGGSKGSLCGNYAMETADVLVAVGSRFVCQSDCSRTGFPNVAHVININTDYDAATHYNRTIALVGDAALTLRKLNALLKNHASADTGESPWFRDCQGKKQQWEAFKTQRYQTPTLYDEMWRQEVLTQPAAIKAVTDWARNAEAITFFDAGDVQANGFQIVEDDRLGGTFTETGASYMGFAVSAILATGMTSKPFYGVALTGDGSFTMNPQILIDAVRHGANGCIVIFDNRRMAAISGLQNAQYGKDYATHDGVSVDYIAWANSVKGVLACDGGHSVDSLTAALKKAHGYRGLSVIHVPVYYGPDPLGGMGVFGRWNVGNWCDTVQAMRHSIGL